MSRSSRSFLRIWHRPKLERLEARLPPGDAMLGLLLAWPDSPLETSELNDDLRSMFDTTDQRAAGLIPALHAVHTAGINPAARNTGSSSASESTLDQRAAGLIPAVYPAGINPAAHRSNSFGTSEIAPEARAAGLIPAVYTAGINPAARNIVRALTNHVPGLPSPPHRAMAF